MSFDPDLCQKYVEMLVRHDEVERALWVLDNIPAHFRVNTPTNLLQLKGEIIANMATAHYYTVSDGDDVEKFHAKYPETQENLKGYCTELIRMRLVGEQVKVWNDAGIIPHIIDAGPGQYLLPKSLLANDLKFTYWDVGLNSTAKAQTREALKSVLDKDAAKTKSTIFVALEIIEHMPREEDLAVDALRLCGRWPEVVMLSTPYCSFKPLREDEDWRKQPLEHLRAYTPNEFTAAAKRVFPFYVWNMFMPKEPERPLSEPMSLVGRRFDLVEKPTHT